MYSILVLSERCFYHGEYCSLLTLYVMYYYFHVVIIVFCQFTFTGLFLCVCFLTIQLVVLVYVYQSGYTLLIVAMATDIL